jgi:hypothetical protein
MNCGELDANRNGAVGRVVRTMLACALGLATLLGPATVRGQAHALHGPIAKLEWMIGGWRCHITKTAMQSSLNAEIVRNVLPTPDGSRLAFEETAVGLVTRGMIGFDPSRGGWYEADRVKVGSSQDQQLTSGTAQSLQAHSFTLLGTLPGQDGQQYGLRTVYAWKTHEAYSFSAQLLRRDKLWQTFERHDCVRATPAGSVPG